jgi:hypothetical protein
MLADRLTERVGPFDEVAGYERVGVTRRRFAMLLLYRGSAAAFVKVHAGQCSAIRTEARAIELAWRSAPTAFRMPRLLDAGEVAGWSFCAVEPLPFALHRMPAHPPLERVVGDLVRALAEMPRPAETPPHWEPMHGDLTPWNLREVGGGELHLVDWEHAGWGPPHAEEVLYRATESAIGGGPVARWESAAEAVEYWAVRIAARSGDARDKRLDAGILRALDAMHRGASRRARRARPVIIGADLARRLVNR